MNITSTCFNLQPFFNTMSLTFILSPLPVHRTNPVKRCRSINSTKSKPTFFTTTPLIHLQIPQNNPISPKPQTQQTLSSSSPTNRRPYGYWKHLSNVVDELKLYLQENPSPIMPTATDLAAAKRYDLSRAIRRHGGWLIVAKAANLIPSAHAHPRSLHLTFCTNIRSDRMRPHGYWLHWSNVRNALCEIIEKEGTIPSARTMERMGRSDVSRAIRRHGGWLVVRRKLIEEGVLHTSHPSIKFKDSSQNQPMSYWTITKIHSVLDSIAQNAGKSSGDLPTWQDVEQYAPPQFVDIIMQFGGLEVMKQDRIRAVNIVKKIAVNDEMPTLEEVHHQAGGRPSVEIIRKGGGAKIVSKSAKLILRRKGNSSKC